MGTTADKLVYLNGTKQEIKDAINTIRDIVGDETFREYADVISRLNPQQAFDFAERVSKLGGYVETLDMLSAFLNDDVSGNESLVMKPHGAGVGFLPSVVSDDGVCDFTVERDCDASRTNEHRIIDLVPNNVPRLDYSDSLFEAVEEESTNLVLWSEPTVEEVLDQHISYESYDWGYKGFTNCVRFEDNALNRSRLVGTLENSKTYVGSLYVIMDDGSEPIVGVSGGDFLIFIGGGSSIASTELVSGNIWRVYFSRTTSPTTSSLYMQVAKNTTSSAKGFRVVGWQLEEGTGPTSYIQTNGSIATRPTTWKAITPPVLLRGPQSTNLALWSEDFSNVVWEKTSGSTVDVNEIISPDGLQNADKITLQSTGYIVQGATFGGNGYICQSFYVKKGTCNIVKIRELVYFGNSITFDLNDGSIVSELAEGGIESLDNDWYRIWITNNYSSQTSLVYVLESTQVGYLYIWGAQLEQQSNPTSYIPTQSSAEVRLQDVVTVAPPLGVAEIIETIDGVEQTPITTIPPIYTVPFGKINKIIMQ